MRRGKAAMHYASGLPHKAGFNSAFAARSWRPLDGFSVYLLITFSYALLLLVVKRASLATGGRMEPRFTGQARCEITLYVRLKARKMVFTRARDAMSFKSKMMLFPQ
jgi:hypothetical protein